MVARMTARHTWSGASRQKFRTGSLHSSSTAEPRLPVLSPNYLLMGLELCAELQASQAPGSHSAVQALGLFLGAIVVPNLIVCARFTALSELFRGWINIEFLLLAAAYLLIRSRLVLVAIAIELVIDLFEPIAHLYYFSDSDAYRSLRYLNAQPWSRLSLYGALVLGYVFTVVVAFRLLMPKRSRPAVRWSAALSALAALLFAADFLCGRYSALGADVTRARLTLVRTPAVSLVRRALVFRTRPVDGPIGPVDSALGRFLARSQGAVVKSRANLVIVLVESWGEMKNGSARAQLEQVYRRPDLLARYSVERGTVPFRGATISGEVREICGRTFPTDIAGAPDPELHSCVPFRFLQEGYSTFGIHGFRPGMYGRQDWYPRVGLSRAFFEPDLTRAGLKTCPGGLTGTCDADVAVWLQQFLRDSSATHPAFIHWVTLNSHLPVEPNSSRETRSACRTASPILQDDGLCAWYRLVQNVHESVFRIAMAARRPTYFVIVGDHAPPFLSTGRRNEFSQSEVPYALLLPRAAGID